MWGRILRSCGARQITVPSNYLLNIYIYSRIAITFVMVIMVSVDHLVVYWIIFMILKFGNVTTFNVPEFK